MQFKRIAVNQPVVRHLYLIAVTNFLTEHTIAVTDAAAISRIAKRCKRVQKAGCQTSESAVSKSCIRLLILNQIDVYAQFLKRLRCLIIRAEVYHIVAKRTSHQKFH